MEPLRLHARHRPGWAYLLTVRVSNEAVSAGVPFFQVARESDEVGADEEVAEVIEYLVATANELLPVAVAALAGAGR